MNWRFYPTAAWRCGPGRETWNDFVLVCRRVSGPDPALPAHPLADHFPDAMNVRLHGQAVPWNPTPLAEDMSIIRQLVARLKSLAGGPGQPSARA